MTQNISPPFALYDLARIHLNTALVQETFVEHLLCFLCCINKGFFGHFFLVQSNKMHWPCGDKTLVFSAIKGIRQFFFSFCYFSPSQVPDKKIDTILSTELAVTRKRRAELTYC